LIRTNIKAIIPICSYLKTIKLFNVRYYKNDVLNFVTDISPTRTYLKKYTENNIRGVKKDLAIGVEIMLADGSILNKLFRAQKYEQILPTDPIKKSEACMFYDVEFMMLENGDIQRIVEIGNNVHREIQIWIGEFV
jgi:hypothetical protein